MNVLMVCSEFAPWAKTGGLADAVTGLSNALVALGHDVRVLLPRYAHLPGAGVRLRRVRSGRHRFGEIETAAGGRAAPRVYLLDLDELTADDIYTADARDAGRFIRLASAALELPAALHWRPDIVHCHDWHAALTPVLNHAAGGTHVGRTVLTLHNVGYQGVFAAEVLDQYAPPQLRTAIAADALAGDDVNFLRAGIHAADVVTTVSPTYAAEIRTPQFGMGLEDVLNARGATLVGILNGVDYDVWDPRNDPFLATHFDATNLAPKLQLKNALAAQLGLQADAITPLVGIVTRLAPQKGIDLVAATLPQLLRETRATFAVLGSGDVEIASVLTSIAREQPERVAFTEGYDEALAHRIFAASDLTLVPSRYEPCGLTQMYALRYGTIPVVRATGGLADTIEHFDAATGRGNGSVFRDADVGGLSWGLRSALGWFDERAVWSRLVANAMAADFSWSTKCPITSASTAACSEDGKDVKTEKDGVRFCVFAQIPLRIWRNRPGTTFAPSCFLRDAGPIMPRQPRLFVPGGFYHVTARGNHQQPLFRDAVDYRALEQIVAMALAPARAQVHAYCWMTNHIHLLVEVSDLPLGVLMQRIGTRFARAVQKRVPTTGHLFENRYHALLVDVDEYFLVLLRYIHLNPVRAGMVAQPDEYRWSSHGIYCGRRQAPWVTTEFGLALFAARTTEARSCYQRYLQESAACDELPANREEPRILSSKPGNANSPLRVPSAPPTSLASLAGGVCAQHGVTVVDLVSTRRRSDLNRAREDLAARALSEGIASQREIAEFLHRSLAAVSRAATRGQSLEGPPLRLESDEANSAQLRKT